MDPVTDLLRQIETFIAEMNMTPTAFGMKAAGDPRFVFALRTGREPRRATRERVLKWLHANQAERAA
jgi:homoserine dehydrogenase